MLEFLKIAAVVVVSSVATSAILAKLFIMFATRVSPPTQPASHASESGAKAAV